MLDASLGLSTAPANEAATSVAAKEPEATKAPEALPAEFSTTIGHANGNTSPWHGMAQALEEEKAKQGDMSQRVPGTEPTATKPVTPSVNFGHGNGKTSPWSGADPDLKTSTTANTEPVITQSRTGMSHQAESQLGEAKKALVNASSVDNLYAAEVKLSRAQNQAGAQYSPSVLDEAGQALLTAKNTVATWAEQHPQGWGAVMQGVDALSMGLNGAFKVGHALGIAESTSFSEWATGYKSTEVPKNTDYTTLNEMHDGTRQQLDALKPKMETLQSIYDTGNLADIATARKHFETATKTAADKISGV